eukprot:6197010-Pleurochrysis_carterae.AAC.2
MLSVDEPSLHLKRVFDLSRSRSTARKARTLLGVRCAAASSRGCALKALRAEMASRSRRCTEFGSGCAGLACAAEPLRNRLATRPGGVPLLVDARDWSALRCGAAAGVVEGTTQRLRHAPVPARVLGSDLDCLLVVLDRLLFESEVLLRRAQAHTRTHTPWAGVRALWTRRDGDAGRA